MIEPGTGLTILGTAVGSAKLLEKLLGPTADYLGEEIKELTKKKVTNLSNIFKNAEKKVGEELNKPGAVPPKVLKGILSEGPWCEEELQVEYFGGVLASSRSGISRDDRGAYFTSLISRLTTYQLRAHYLLYHAFKFNFKNYILNDAHLENLEELEISIPEKTYLEGMDFTGDEKLSINQLTSHAFWGLRNENLIGPFFYGDFESHKNRVHEEDSNKYKVFDNGREVGMNMPMRSKEWIIEATPSPLGIELMMWAYGHGKKDIAEFFHPDLLMPDSQDLNLEFTEKKLRIMLISDQNYWNKIKNKEEKEQ